MSLGSPAKFDKSINSKFNESTLFLLKMVKPSISLETTISRERRKKESVMLVKIYKASLDNDKWINITELLTVIITVQPTLF
jgi:hypothetical protein